jgi:hypothetical protein
MTTRPPRGIRSRLHSRADARLTHDHISSQRRLALWLTSFAAVRTGAWLAAMGLIVAHWTGVSGAFLHGFIHLSSSIIFVTFISFYCNASTDAANMVAGFAALFSADSHATGASLAADLEVLKSDIARLSGLPPGPEADGLAESIRQKLDP